ncbi:hypothetical protein K1719_023055 [Acacia pycnantha]|nr:hypothetical protein K1719_023055 [Acacia pycnantha]
MPDLTHHLRGEHQPRREHRGDEREGEVEGDESLAWREVEGDESLAWRSSERGEVHDKVEGNRLRVASSELHITSAFFSKAVDFGHTIEAYGKATHELAVNLAKKIQESVLGLSIAPEEVLDLENWRCELRLNKFKFSPEEIGDYGLHWHTDGGFLNVLQDDDEIDGLEAWHSPSNCFVPVTPAPGTFFINIGDVAHVWSNGRFENVKHHVKCNVATPRYSTSTFLLAPRDRNVEAGKEFVDK